MIVPGSYMQGFAPRDFAPAEPILWQSRLLSLCPSLGNSGATVRDWGGRKIDGAISGATWGITGARQGLSHTSSGDYVNIGILSDVAGLSRFSVGGWFYLSALTTDMRFCGKWSGASSTQSWLVTADASGAKVVCAIRDPSNYLIVTTTNSVLAAGSWCHIWAVLQAGTWTLYINGVSVPLTVNASGGTTIQASPGLSTYIGNVGDGAPSFTGAWDDFAIYDYATPPAVTALAMQRPGIAYEWRTPVRTIEQAGGGGGVKLSWWAWNNYGLCAGAA